MDSIPFSCHGVVDTDEPFNSGLEMFDARLTIGNLSGSGAAGRLAFLSACESAVGSVQNADELVSLASALQFAGWQEVIATFAPVRDDIAAETARIFYERLKDSVDSGRLPEARSLIAHATRQIRSRWPDRPSHWAPFAHFGSS